MTRCDQRATGERYGSSSGKAEPCQGGESRGGRPRTRRGGGGEGSSRQARKDLKGRCMEDEEFCDRAQTTAEEELLGGWSRLPTYGMSTAHGDLRGRAGGSAGSGSVVGSTAGRARGSRHRASRRRARRGVRNSYRDGRGHGLRRLVRKVSFAEFSKKRGHTHRILSGFSSHEN